MIITLISDTHTKHKCLDLDLYNGGDILIHAGDLMNSGHSLYDIENFCKWFEWQDYCVSLFIAGNHDRLFEYSPKITSEIVNKYVVDYLQDSSFYYEDVSGNKVKLYGSPWQPEFYNWAFNLPRNGEELRKVWQDIPDDVDILITHGPPMGHLDVSGPPYNKPDLGCELLRARVDEIKPKIHVFGHIHGGYGYKFYNGTHFINASVLNEKYEYVNKPITIDWDPSTNEIKFL